MIRKVDIIGLFGERDISVNLDSSVKIIVGENGTGKTHVLNIIYYLMSNQLIELKKIDFHKLIIYTDKDVFKLRKKELNEFFTNDKVNRGPLAYIKRYLTKFEYEELIDGIMKGIPVRELAFFNDKHNRRPNILRAIRDLEHDIERGRYRDELIYNKDSSNVKYLKEYLSKSFSRFQKNSMIYLPTYRRIERGLQHLIKNDDLVEEFSLEDSDSLINFGMQDTSEIIESLLSEISDSFLQAYAELSSDMLKELLKANDSDIEDIRNLDLEIVDLVLKRVGSKISEQDKGRILDIVYENETTLQNYPILSMIKNLIELYEGSTKKLEDKIEKFVEVCNRYLVEKEFIYSKNNVTLYISNHYTKNKISIDSLSSGEKQIVSLFAKIYLKETSRFMMFFDEPELSLSIEWQKMLLTDILNTDNCEFLFVTTHSPFIFDYEKLFEITDDISELTNINFSLKEKRLSYE